MSAPRLRTAIVGFGRVAQGYAKDALTARHFRYATHAQVLAEHPDYRWVAVVDPDREALRTAAEEWQVSRAVERTSDLGAEAAEVDVAVLATPPESRLGVLDDFPRLRAVVVEKPLAPTLAGCFEFSNYCRKRDLLVQVNFWRRADERMRSLKAGELGALVGTPQCAFGTYGGGLLNNGIHMVDLVRMLLGEVACVQAFEASALSGTAMSRDSNLAFTLFLTGGTTVFFHPLDFDRYRENSLDIWGDAGRMSIGNEGLSAAAYRKVPHRALQGASEIECDAPAYLQPTAGHALYHMYSNLAAAINHGEPLLSPAESALRTSAVVDAITRAARDRAQVQVPNGGVALE